MFPLPYVLPFLCNIGHLFVSSECSWMGLCLRVRNSQNPLPFIHRALILMPKKRGKKEPKSQWSPPVQFFMLSTTQICSFYYFTKTVFLYRTIQRRVHCLQTWLYTTQRKTMLWHQMRSVDLDEVNRIGGSTMITERTISHKTEIFIFMTVC